MAGLDRGLLASAGDEVAADDAARKLESIGDVVELPKDLDLLQGQWRLVYSSGFVTGSLGGQRPGPPVGRLLPLNLGQVHLTVFVFWVILKLHATFIKLNPSCHFNQKRFYIGD